MDVSPRLHRGTNETAQLGERGWDVNPAVMSSKATRVADPVTLETIIRVRGTFGHCASLHCTRKIIKIMGE